MFKGPSKKRFLHNFLDKHFKDMLYPLHVAASILLLPNYNILDGFITPISRFQKFKALTLTVGLIVIVYIRFELSFEFSHNKNSVSSFPIFSLYFEMCYYCFSFICLFASNVTNTTNYVKLVLNLQKALRNFHCIDNIMHTLKRLTFRNWASMASVPAYYLFCFTTCGRYTFAGLMNFLPLIYFDVSVVSSIRLMKIIQEELRMWVEEMERCLDQELMKDKTVEPQAKKIFETYRYILEAFHLFTKVCEVPILFQIVDTTSHLLLYLQVNIDERKQVQVESSVTNLRLIFGTISISVWVMKNGVLLWILCNTCEQFYSLEARAKIICSEAFKFGITDEYRRLCKNVQRLSRARSLRVRVCGTTIDARLPLRVASILAAYTAVMLQFDFL